MKGKSKEKVSSFSSFLKTDEISSLIEKLVDKTQALSQGFFKDVSLDLKGDLKPKASNKNQGFIKNHSQESGEATQYGEDIQYNEDIQKVGKNRGRALFFPYIGSGLGRGPYVQLKNGQIQLDLIGGIGVHILGHGHREILRTSVKASLSDIVMQGNLQLNEDYLKLSHKLLELAQRKSSLSHVWITTSGSMANENALKICRQKKSGARKIITFENAFAGRTTLMTEISDKPDLTEGLPRYDEILRIPFFDKKDPQSFEKVQRALKKHLADHEGDICTFVFEPVLGEGGFRYAPRDYFLPLLALCKQHSIPVWADEVQTFCRTGEFFAYELLDIGSWIDVCTVSKALQNGATFYTQKMLPRTALLGGTYAGSTQSLAVGYKILELLDQGNYMGKKGRISKIRSYFLEMLNRLSRTSCGGLISDIDGVGLMVALTPFDGSQKKVLELIKILFKNGLMAFFCGRNPYRLRFLLPAILEEIDIKRAEKILEKSFLELKVKN